MGQYISHMAAGQIMKHNITKQREFSQKERKKIYERDNGQCIFCSMNYHMEGTNWFNLQIDGVMHYIPRSQNGLGIEQNGALGCKHHHYMLDHGSRREEMLDIFKQYLKAHYKDWDESKLIYSKWKCFEEV